MSRVSGLLLSFVLGAALVGFPLGWWWAQDPAAERSPSDHSFEISERQGLGDDAAPEDRRTRVSEPVVDGNSRDPFDEVGETRSGDSRVPADLGGSLGVLKLYGADGALREQALGVRVGTGGQEILAPLHVLSGAYAATWGEEPARRVLEVSGRMPSAGLAILTLERASGEGLAEAAEEVSGRFEATMLVLVQGGRRAVQERPIKTRGLDGRRPERGAFGIDAAAPELGAAIVTRGERRLIGIVPSRRAGENDLELRRIALPVSRDRLAALENLKMSLEDYQRAFYEGSAESWLAKARRALAERRFEDAVRAFRQAASRDRGVKEVHRADWQGAHESILADIGRSRTKPRLNALDEALFDFESHGPWHYDIYETAFRAKLYRRALEALDGTARFAPQLVPDLDASRTGVYRRWAEGLERQGRLEEALDVLVEARSQVRGDAALWELYGRLLLKIRDYAGAADAFEDAISLSSAPTASLETLRDRALRFAEGPGKVVIDYAPGSRTIIAEVTLNGRFRGEFIVDTGATSTFVPEILAKRAGMDLSNRVPRVTVRTAGNERNLPYSPVDEISVGGLAISGISVVVGDLPGTGQKGLLGMDYLGRFGFENDTSNGRFVIFEKH